MRTIGPLLGIVSTTPSDSSWRSASRITVRDTPVIAISSRSTSRAPGGSRPSMMAVRSASTTLRLSGAAERGISATVGVSAKGASAAEVGRVRFMELHMAAESAPAGV